MMQSIPLELMFAMRKRFGLEQFVETGTYHGKSAMLATSQFDLVTTCDIDPEKVKRLTGLRLPSPKRLVAICGNSPDVLRTIFADPDCKPALVWLDAHWSEGPKLGPECPLLDELLAIGGTHGKHVILIDDARLFLNPPPPPHDPGQWPTFNEIRALCAKIRESCLELEHADVVEVFGDVIVIRPDREPDKCLNC
jgi:hypothetical protein